MVDITREGIRVALLSRNELAREGLRRILISQDFVVCGSVRDSTALASGQTKDGDPEIIIVDNAGSAALETCRELNERYPQARLVLLADNFDIEEVALAFGRG